MDMDDATTSRRTAWPPFTRRSSRTAVPRTLSFTYGTIAYMDCPTPTCAARWTTDAAPSSARSTAAASHTEARTSSTPGGR
jgi:hypothetical protein